MVHIVGRIRFFIKLFIQGGSWSSQVMVLLGIKFEKSKMLIALLIWSEFAYSKCHTVLSYGGGKVIFKSNFAYIIWWWQFECKEACTPESITILGWDVNIKSMQDLELSSICVGSFIICKSPNWEVRKSNSKPSKLVISIEHQSLDLAFKSNAFTKIWNI